MGAFLTDIGGLAVQYFNNTGVASVKGTTVRITAPYTVGKVQIDIPDCIGVVLKSGVPNGQMMDVVISGIAAVLFSTATVAGQLARTPLTTDGVTGVVGQALAENFPTSPFATDKHFCEIGHCIETNTVVGTLSNVNLHYN